MKEHIADNSLLSNKQQRFVDEYVVDCNATQAAIRAGYSSASASQQASRLLTKDNIQTAIQRSTADIKTCNQMDANWKRQKLRELVEAGMKPAVDSQGNIRPVQGMLAARSLEILCKLDGDFPTTKGVVGILSDNPLRDLMNEIAHQAKEDGPLGNHQH